MEGEREAAGGPSKPFRPALRAATAPLLALRATSPVSGESVLKGEAFPRAKPAQKGAPFRGAGRAKQGLRGFDGPSQYRPHPRSRPLQKLPPCRGRACPARGLPIAARTPSITARTPSTAGPDMSGPYRSITQKAPAQPRAGAFLYHSFRISSVPSLQRRNKTSVPPAAYSIPSRYPWGTTSYASAR